jgi:hypothetical protein
MFAETGAPVLLGLFCEVNAGVLATAYAAAGAHWATAYWDQAYARNDGGSPRSSSWCTASLRCHR